MPEQFFVVYISPNGSTRAVADELAAQLVQGGHDVTLLDLADGIRRGSVLKKITAAEQACLLIGSPVYRDMAVPPVMEFIAALPEAKNLAAVPFVTWGLACSGVALWQMGRALIQKGCRLSGAAKVAGVHSMMWPADAPVGAGHPDHADKQLVRELAGVLMNRRGSLSLADLDYQPGNLAAEFKAKITKPWMVIPKTVDIEACTQCGDCEAECPVEAVVLAPYPQFGDNCFDCFTCVRICPEDAIHSGVPLAKIEAMIRERVRTINEQPPTQIFV